MKIGDVVKVVSVSGHSDIEGAIGMHGVIDDERTSLLNCRVRNKRNFKFHVTYALPIECTCPKKCGNYWQGEWMAEEELELIKEA
jgi:hypothetical protein